VKDAEISEMRATIERMTLSFETAANEKVEAQNEIQNLLHALSEAENNLKQISSQLERVTAEKIEVYRDAENHSIELAASRRIAEERLREIERLEGLLQQRVVDSATLHSDVRTLTETVKTMEIQLKSRHEEVASLNAQLQQVKQDKDETVAEMSSQLATTLEEVQYLKESLDAKTDSVNSFLQQLTTAKEALVALKAKEAEQAKELVQAADTLRRAEAAEEALAKLDDKKRRDLENLKKQNERIALVQREKAEIERASQDAIADLRAQLDQAVQQYEDLKAMVGGDEGDDDGEDGEGRERGSGQGGAKERIALQERIHQLEAELSAANERVVVALKEAETYAAEVSALKDQLRDHQSTSQLTTSAYVSAAAVTSSSVSGSAAAHDGGDGSGSSSTAGATGIITTRRGDESPSESSDSTGSSFVVVGDSSAPNLHAVVTELRMKLSESVGEVRR
jgi:chromosome segregation ATPase